MNATQIDLEQITSSFGIYLQSRSSQWNLDQARVDVAFLDTSGLILDSFFFVDEDINGDIDWNYFSDSRLIFAGTRSVEILLTTTRTGGVSSDGFFDDVSFQISETSTSPVPEPATILLFGAGIVGLAGTRVRRKKK